MIALSAREPSLTLGAKLQMLNWGLVLAVCLLAAAGTGLLYSAAGGSWEPWAGRHIARFAALLPLAIVLGLIDVRIWMKLAYWIYLVVLLLLVLVEIMGHIGMGAQRWINFGFFVIQPSELMKPALVLALARYFHSQTLDRVGRPLVLVPPLLLIAMPVGLVLLQPNLGTALLLILASGAVFWCGGVRLWKFLLAIGAGVAAVPVGWQFLHDYQRQRVYTFLEPERDPLGAGYNIMQSKIAFGSGGIFGKGFMEGTQSQLMFLPEKHTDFIFVVLAEEFGLAGCLLVLGLLLVAVVYGYAIALSARSQFGRLTGIGLTTSFFLYLLVNVAMITGLIPVVGIPMPLVSYGGTAMMTVLIGFGLLLSVSIHREARIPRAGVMDD
jgi:rod shape determining protein RodA